MHNQIKIIIPVFLLFLFFNLQAIIGSDIESPGTCYAQATGTSTNAFDQKNNLEMAKKLRAQGTDLQKKGQLADAIDKYELSQSYYPDATLAGHIKTLRNALAKQYMEAAKKLREEGAVLQQQGKIEAAIEKYMLAQKYYPDAKLAEHISGLQKAYSKPKFELGGKPEGFKEELVAIERLKKDPSRANIDALAELRYQYALTLTQVAAKKNNEDAYKLAFQYAQSATELSPDNADYWSVLGQLYDTMGDDAIAEIMAEDALQRAVAINPNDVRKRLLLGQFFFRHENYTNALKQFETALKIDPKFLSSPLIATMCSSYILSAGPARGLNFFREILPTQANPDSVRLAIAILLHEQKNTVQAREELNKIVNRKEASSENREYALMLLEDWKKEGVKP
ncbi:MAG: hypothetical protein NT178_14890 [Proteobacteria bacterium]|nr:hypothetical protein [Pseudomonadota bacterium]